MSIVELAGWVAFAALMLLLLVQTRSLRSFVRPRATEGATWPTLTVVIDSAGEESEIRRLHAEVAAFAYNGEIEILVVADDEREAEALRSLTVASSRTRVVVRAWDSSSDIPGLTEPTRGELVLVLPAYLHVEPEAAAAFVSAALRDGHREILVLPRLEMDAKGFLVSPMVPWLCLTLAPIFATGTPASAGALLIDTAGTSRSGVRVIDGFETISRRASAQSHALRALEDSAGRSPGRRVAVSLLLLLLFTAPPIVALATTAFPWLVAAIVSYWMRLRVAARTGEPIPTVILHPVAAFVIALMLLRASPAETRTAG